MDLSQLTGHIWLDGEMVPWQEARVHVLTHTFHYGLGVFEGVRAYKTSDGAAIFRLARSIPIACFVPPTFCAWRCPLTKGL